MPIGTVKWFKDKFGYGFLNADDIQGDIFVHHSVIQMEGHRTLTEKQRVEFEFERGDKGFKATTVTPLVPR